MKDLKHTRDMILQHKYEIVGIGEDLKHTRDMILQHKYEIVGIGEIGLDFTPTICSTNELQDLQKSIFTIQIQLAKQLNLPVNVHSRSAGKETIDILKSE
ncbi:TatD DNase family protein, partial [Schistosoma bovis]